jgi:hypothetical protein
MVVDVLYVSAAETRELLDLADALVLVEEALRWQAEGKIVWSEPPLRSTGPPTRSSWTAGG